MNTAEYLIKRLEELGINDFFGLPGDYNFDIIYAIDNNKNTNWIGCTNELNAGYAADGYARVRGYGAVVTTYGVGELSAINAVAGSMAESVPVVCIVGVPSTSNIDKKALLHHNLHDVNYNAFADAYKSVTITTAFLSRDNAKLEIDRVLKTIIKEKKPVYIAIPQDIAQMEISDRVVSYEWTSEKETLAAAAQKIADKIKASQRPVIIGDILVKRYDAVIEFKEFVAKSGIPVSNFLMGINLTGMDYEKYIGGYFADYRNPIAQKYIEESDCLITIGPIYSDLNSYGMKLPFKINEQIAIYGNYAYVEGRRYNNIKMTDLLEAVTELIETKNIEIDRPNTGYKHKIAEQEELNSDYMYSRIQEFIKDNDIIVSEIGTVPYGIAQMKFPNSADIHLQMLWGSIGWATAATLGVCVAKPQSRVILLTGEGAHQLSAFEVGTMLRLGLKPIIIVVNNKGYSTERLLCRNPKEKFNDIVQMNYAKFARVFEGDVWATKVSSAEDFDKALKVTQIMNKMCYIEACLEEGDIPQLLQDIAYAAKDAVKNTKLPEKSNKNFDSIDELILTTPSSGFEYETIVHKAYQEEDNSTDKVPEAEDE